MTSTSIPASSSDGNRVLLARLKLLATLAVRNLMRSRRRTVISLATVSFGVAALILAGGFVDALLVKLREDVIYSQLGHLQVQHPAYAESGLTEPYAHLLRTDAASLDVVAHVPGVRLVTPRVNLAGLISVGETTLSFAGQAIDPAKETLLARGVAITSGTTLLPNDEQGVILGEGLAASLGVRPGDKVALLVNTAGGSFNGTDMVVRGTFASASRDYDDFALRLPLSTAQKLLRIQGAQQWLVLLDDTGLTERVLHRFREILPKNAYAVTTWAEQADFYHKAATLFARQFGFIRVVVMTIIVLSILNTMTMNVLERTWEIGVMLALGDSRGKVLALFAAEGLLLGLIGSGVGAVLGVAAGLAINAVGIPMPAPPGMSHGFDVGISLSVLLMLSASVIGAITTVAASLPPSVRASRMPVIDALRASR